LAAGQTLDRKPRSGVCPQKGARDRLIRWAASKPAWVLGYEDECWWSRVSNPAMHGWSDAGRPVRVLDKKEAVPKGEPQALSCYGVWLPEEGENGRMLLRFVEGRPVSAVTEPFLEWVSAQLFQAGKAALLLVWDNASWHDSARVRAWLREHNQQVKRGEKEGVRLIVCPLPTRSPWLNPIEPKWLHGKRAVAEPSRVLESEELRDRVHQHYQCVAHPLLSKVVS
jgi:hypothetical protein